MLDPENVGDDQPRKRRPTHIPLPISGTTEASQRGVVNPRGSQGTGRLNLHTDQAGGGRGLDGLSWVPLQPWQSAW